MSSGRKILLFIGLLVAVVFTVVEMGAYDIIKFEWISFMEVQPSYRPMEEPRPIADRSIPIDGPASIPGVAASNPIPADKVSVERGRLLYSVTCVQCHGPSADGKGIVGAFLVTPPADLTGAVVQAKLDSDLFNTITNGIVVKDPKTGKNQIHMPALNENLTVRDRWDLVNFIRSLKAGQPTPTPQ